jgi:hypothetical protein
VPKPIAKIVNVGSLAADAIGVDAEDYTSNGPHDSGGTERSN